MSFTDLKVLLQKESDKNGFVLEIVVIPGNSGATSVEEITPTKSK